MKESPRPSGNDAPTMTQEQSDEAAWPGLSGLRLRLLHPRLQPHPAALPEAAVLLPGR